MGRHYVCLGLCRGVSDTPGFCNHLGCPKEGELLVECNCDDRHHRDRASKEPHEEGEKKTSNDKF